MFTYTPLGWFLLFGSILALIGIIRSAIVPVRSAVISEPEEPELLDALIFVGLLFGLVKWSWFDIFPTLADSIGIPETFSEQLAAAIGISLMVGVTALVACSIAESLRAIGASLFLRRFARTHPVHP